MLTLGLHPIPLHDVVVVMGPFKRRLHLGQLMLHAIQLNTGLFSRCAHLPNFLFFFAELEVDTLVLIGQLLREGVLQTHHQDLNGDRAVTF